MSALTVKTRKMNFPNRTGMIQHVVSWSRLKMR